MKFNNETIREAVKEWCNDEESALKKYGFINDWDTSEVTDMSELFLNAHEFNSPIGNWDVSKVENMNGMFWSANSFNQPIGNWDVSNVTNMKSMFATATSFNQPIGDWDVSNVKDMSLMFCNAKSFNQPLEKWDVSNVTNMDDMFFIATSFNQDINSWKINSSIDNDTDNDENIEEDDDGIYLMYEGTLFTYINENGEEMTFEAFRLIVECPGAEDYEWEVKDALGELVFTEKKVSEYSYETYLVTDLPEDIVDYEFTNSVGNLHDKALNSIEEAVEFIKNLKTVSFKDLNPKNGESIRFIN